jgi:hypothetical protein
MTPGMRNVDSGRINGAALMACLIGGCANRPLAPDTQDTTGEPEASALVQLASIPNCGALDLVVAKGSVFWTERDTGRVRRVSTAGSAPTILASDQSLPGPIAADDTGVYWANAGDKTLMKLEQSSETPTVLVPATHRSDDGVAPDADDINGLLVDEGTVYFGRFTDALKVPTAGGTPVVLGRSPSNRMGRPARFVVDASHLYQTELVQYAISREGLDGAQDGLLDDGRTRAPLVPDWMADSQGGLVVDALALTNGALFWANGNIIVSQRADQIEVPGTGPAPNRVAFSASYDPITGFVLSGDAIYLGESVDDAVEKVPAGNGAPGAPTPEAVVIARNQPNAGQFAADDANVYWRTLGMNADTGAQDCKIMKLAK